MTNLTLSLPKDVDQLSTKQKIVAGGLALGVGMTKMLIFLNYEVRWRQGK